MSNIWIAASLEQKSSSTNGRKSYQVVPKENGNYHNQAKARSAAQDKIFFANKETKWNYFQVTEQRRLTNTNTSIVLLLTRTWQNTR